MNGGVCVNRPCLEPITVPSNGVYEIRLANRGDPARLTDEARQRAGKKSTALLVKFEPDQIWNPGLLCLFYPDEVQVWMELRRCGGFLADGRSHGDDDVISIVG